MQLFKILILELSHSILGISLDMYYYHYREEILSIVSVLSVDSVLFTPQSKVCRITFMIS